MAVLYNTFCICAYLCANLGRGGGRGIFFSEDRVDTAGSRGQGQSVDVSIFCLYILGGNEGGSI